MAAILRRKRLLGTLAASAFFVGVNWLVFIWAVNAGHVLQSSLGYFITPLINVVLGAVFLGERHRFWQWAAIAVAAAGVLNQIVIVGVFPWIALALGVSFGFYGLIRKRAEVGSLEGLLVEAGMFLVPAVIYLAVRSGTGGHAFGGDGATATLLVLTGAVTAVPLVLFAEAAKRLRLAALGLLQYITPTGHFILAVAVYDETFTTAHLVTFAIIWLALAMFSWNSLTAGGNAR